MYILNIERGNIMTTTVQKWGNSHGIRIPKVILDEINLKYNDEIMIHTENNKIIISKTEKRQTIKDLFENFNDEYVPVNIDWGTPAGDEIW